MLGSSSPTVEQLASDEVALASEQPSRESFLRPLNPETIKVPFPGSRFPGSRPAPSVARILVVEDDQPLSRFLSRTLAAAAHQVELAHDGNTALQLLRPAVDLVILDINLPGLDGFSVLRSLRPLYPKLPVLVLTALSRTEDTVMAFESGADDCLLKPFSYLELLARVNALLRRNSGVLPKTTSVHDLLLRRDEHRVERAGRRIELTPREFKLLEFLMRTPGTPISRATLMEEVWGTEFDPSTNVVDVYMKYLRDKIDLHGEAKLVRTVRGVGYVVGAE